MESFCNTFSRPSAPACKAKSNTTGVPAKVNQLANFPLNFLRTGLYNYSDGKVYYRTADGRWWTGASDTATRAHALDTTTGYFGPQAGDARGQGFALRCAKETAAACYFRKICYILDDTVGNY